MKIFWLSVVLLCIPVLCSAQANNKKAERYFQAALSLYRSQQYEQALEQLIKAEKNSPNLAKIFLLRADIYADKQQDSLSIVAYQKAVDLEPQRYSSAYKLIAQMAYKNGQYKTSKEAMQHYLTYVKTAGDTAKVAKASNHIEDCNFALEQMSHTCNYFPQNMGQAVNTNKPEYFPCPNLFQNSLWFTRRLDSNGGTQEDFFISHYQPTIGWSLAEALPYPINTLYNEGAASLSADGQFLVFAACETQPSGGAYGDGKHGFGSCDLFYSQRINGKWTQPKNMGRAINTSMWESQPSLSADGRTLYFIRATNRSKANTDIYMSKRLPTGEWTKAETLPSYINTPQKEMSVMIHPNDCALYFASNGHRGMGGLDIFVCRRPHSLSAWEKPENLGYPINTYKDENALQVSHDGQTAFFASDREGGFGDMDLYSVQLPLQWHTTAVSYLNISVIDANTKAPVQAVLHLAAHSDSTQKIIASTDKEGKLFVTFANTTTYALSVSKPSYLFYSDSVALQHALDNAYQKEIALQPIQKGARMRLSNIYFDIDKSSLKEESYTELRNVKQLLIDNPALCIRIEGHTDNSGSSSYNQSLSQARAKAVYDFLIGENIARERLQYVGYGDSKPVADNITVEGKSENRRTEFVVISDR